MKPPINILVAAAILSIGWGGYARAQDAEAWCTCVQNRSRLPLTLAGVIRGLATQPPGRVSTSCTPFVASELWNSCLAEKELTPAHAWHAMCSVLFCGVFRSLA